ncbi:MAG TPA: hypothetical protein VIT67_15230 [Povalibacter sp.]
MKAFLVLIILGVAGYYGYQHFKGGEGEAPDVIESPVYADVRLDMNVAGRELQFALFGKMASQADCDVRSNMVWGKVIDGCKECVQRTSVCKTQLEPRYQRLFDNTAIHSTYISFTRGSKVERDGRMVIFGLTADEGDAICKQTLAHFQANYAGKIECVLARRD